ncbi:hypothetical protein NDU88_000155 [Pleurodeles waltl]|uniref:Uncharacterized protein n=1 Tax=Pleurodeles waltl TaxID=8319 RepID=A0AAV7VWK2_PLEWA|nr:hypothetical protein NDU88_000155 [Pleurodeles waltl]
MFAVDSISSNPLIAYHQGLPQRVSATNLTLDFNLAPPGCVSSQAMPPCWSTGMLQPNPGPVMASAPQSIPTAVALLLLCIHPICRIGCRKGATPGQTAASSVLHSPVRSLHSRQQRAFACPRCVA